MMSISRRSEPMMSPPPTRTAPGASPTEAQGAKGIGQKDCGQKGIGQGPKDAGQGPRADPKAKPDGACATKTPPATETEAQRQQAMAKDRRYLSNLSDSFQQLPPKMAQGYGLEDPIKAQVDAEQQSFQDILANIVPEA